MSWRGCAAGHRARLFGVSRKRYFLSSAHRRRRHSHRGGGATSLGRNFFQTTGDYGRRKLGAGRVMWTDCGATRRWRHHMSLPPPPPFLRAAAWTDGSELGSSLSWCAELELERRLRVGAAGGVGWIEARRWEEGRQTRRRQCLWGLALGGGTLLDGGTLLPGLVALSRLAFWPSAVTGLCKTGVTFCASNHQS
jgi:hypothetical protein